MADIAKTIEILFEGIDNVSSVTESIGDGISDLGSGIKDIAAPFAAASEAIVKFETALAALTAGGLVYAYNKASEFESAVSELNKVLADGESSDAAISYAKQLSETYGESMKDIVLSTADFKQAGYDSTEAMTLVKDSMDLAIAGSIGVEQAGKLVIATLKGFGEGATSASTYIDILNEVSNNYATSAEELAEGMARISPIAGQMGFSMEEAAGLLTPIIEIFGSGSEAANGLRTGLLRLTDDSKPAVDALTQLGVSQNDANGKLKSGKEIFYEVAAAMGTLDDSQRSFLTQQLVGIEQAPKMSVLFSDLGKVTNVTATALDSAGSAAKEVAIRLETSEVAVNKFKAGFEALAVTIGNEFKSSATSAVNGATEIEKALGSLVEGGTFDSLLGMVSEFSDGVGTLLTSIAKDLPEAFESVDFSSLTDGLDNLGSALSGMFDGIDLTTPEGLSSVIQTVIDALGGLQNASAGIVEFMTPITDTIGTLITKFSELSPSTQELIGQITAFGTALSGVATVLATGGALLSGIGALGTAFLGPAGLVVGLASLTTGLIAATGAMADWASDTWNAKMIASTKALEEQNAQVEDLLNQLNGISWDSEKRLDIIAAIDTGDFDKAKQLIDEATAQEQEMKVKASLEREQFENDYDKILALGSLSENELKILASIDGKDEIQKAIDEITAQRELAVKAKVDTATATQEIEVWTENHGTMTVTVPVDTSAVDKAKEKVKELPTEKELEIKLKGEIDTKIAQIKADAELAQSAFEWTAKVDIAEAEAATKQIEAAFSAINTQIEAAAGIYSAAFEGSESSNFQARQEAISILEQEQEIMEQNAALQEKLTNAQIAQLEAQTEALKSGDGMAIKIDSSGLEPALELVMWEILKKVQLRANETASEFLLGIN